MKVITLCIFLCFHSVNSFYMNEISKQSGEIGEQIPISIKLAENYPVKKQGVAATENHLLNFLTTIVNSLSNSKRWKRMAPPMTQETVGDPFRFEQRENQRDKSPDPPIIQRPPSPPRKPMINPEPPQPKIIEKPMEECVSKAELKNHELQEKNTLDNLRQELAKLKSLVQVLRDEQYILNILHEMIKDNNNVIDTKLRNSESGLDFKNITAEMSGLKSLLHRLNVTGENSTEIPQIKLPTTAINSSTLINTEDELRDEIKKQREEIQKLRELIEDIHDRQKDTEVFPIHINQKARFAEETEDEDAVNPLMERIQILRDAIENLQNHDDFVGLKMQSRIKPLKIPLPKRIKPLKTETRASSSEDLQSLLNLLDGGKSETRQDDLEDRLSDLETRLKISQRRKKKKSQKETIEAEIDELERELKRIDRPVESKILDDDNEEEVKLKIRELQRRLKKLGKTEVESKDLNNNGLDGELFELEQAINRLRPKEEDPNFLQGKDEQDRFQAMLTTIINQNLNPQSINRRPNFSNLNPNQINLLSQMVNVLQQQQQQQGNNPIPSFKPYQGFYQPNRSPNPFYDYPNSYMNYNGYLPPANPIYPPQEQPRPYPQPQPYQPPKNFFPAPPPPQYPKANPAEPYKPPDHPLQYNQPQAYGNPPANPNPGNDYPPQKVDDLKAEINDLQGIISGLNRPEYTKKPEDQQTIYQLDQQINELKNVINQMGPDQNYGNYEGNNAPQPNQDRYRNQSPRGKRSAEINPWEHLGSFVRELLSGDVEKEDANTHLRESHADLYRKLGLLKKQLGSKIAARNSETYPYSYPNYQEGYQQNYQSYPVPYFPKPESKVKTLIKEKKFEIWEKIVTKVTEKAIQAVFIAVPLIAKSFFGIGFKGVANNYGQKGYEYGLEEEFQQFGIAGYIPVIILKLLKKLSTFVYYLQKNKFVKYFLVPGLITALSAGLVVFLTWWLTNGDYYNDQPRIGYGSTYKPYPYQKQESNYNQYEQNNYNNDPYAYRRNGPLDIKQSYS